MTVAVDEHQMYFGWSEEGGETGCLASPVATSAAVWKVAAVDHSGEVMWTQPPGSNGPVDVICLAAAATTVMAAGYEHRDKGSPSQLTPVLGRVSPTGQVLSVVTISETDGHRRWGDCAFDSASSSLVLVGSVSPSSSESAGWVTVRSKGTWVFSKIFHPPVVGGAIPYSLWGWLSHVAVTDGGGYVACGWTGAKAWVLGLDHEGRERFSVSLGDFYSISSPLVLPTGGFMAFGLWDPGGVSWTPHIWNIWPVLRFDSWGNIVDSKVVGRMEFISSDGVLPWSTADSSGAVASVWLSGGSVAAKVTGNELVSPGNERRYWRRLYRMDPWGFASCEEAGACSSLALADCDDGDPCTADLCKPAQGCVHVSYADWKIEARCGEGKVCKSDGTCAAK